MMYIPWINGVYGDEKDYDEVVDKYNKQYGITREMMNPILLSLYKQNKPYKDCYILLNGNITDWACYVDQVTSELSCLGYCLSRTNTESKHLFLMQYGINFDDCLKSYRALKDKIEERFQSVYGSKFDSDGFEYANRVHNRYLRTLVTCKSREGTFIDNDIYTKRIINEAYRENMIPPVGGKDLDLFTMKRISFDCKALYSAWMSGKIPTNVKWFILYCLMEDPELLSLTDLGSVRIEDEYQFKIGCAYSLMSSVI